MMPMSVDGHDQGLKETSKKSSKIANAAHRVLTGKVDFRMPDDDGWGLYFGYER
jgi:hypothetical protein